MDSSWETRECHFTWNLEKDKRVYKYEDKILRKVENNLEETQFLKIENLLFKACLQSWVKDQSVINALASLDGANREIELLRNKDVYKGYKSVELLNRIWIEHKILPSNKILPKLHEELEAIQLEKKDLRVVGAIRAAALMRLGPVMFDTNLALFKAAHQAFPSNPNFLFGVALLTGQKVGFERPIPSSYESLDPLLKNMMDEEKECWEKLIARKPDHQGYHYAKSMLGLNLSRRDGSDDINKASELLNEAYDEAPQLQEVCRNLIRMLKKTDLDRSISILETAIAYQHDRTENHHQLAICCIDKAKQEKQNKRETPDKEKKKGHQEEAVKWTKKALEELNKCLKLDGSHFYALLKKAQQVRILDGLSDESPEDCYINMMPLSQEFMPMKKIKLYNSFASYLYYNKTKSTPKFTALEMSQLVMDTCTDESFEYQNDITGKWEIRTQVTSYKRMAYKTLKKQYKYNKNHLKLGILFYQNFEFDKAIDMLATVDQTNAEVPYYLAKSYLKMGQEKTVGNQAKPAEAAEDFTRARENVELTRESRLEPQKVREVLADIALTIAHNELQANANDIQLEDRCVTSYREAVRCGSLVAVLELMKLVEKGLIKITSSSNFIQMLAEIEVCCSQSQSDILHGESKPQTFEGGLRSKETNIEPCMLRNRTKIKENIKGILSKETFFWESREALFNVEVQLLMERFKVAIKDEDGLLLDGREEGPLEDVSRNMKNKAVLSCRETRPLLDRIMELFKKEELEMEEEQGNYFPLILKDEKLTPETLKGELKKKLKLPIDMETHYPKIYECILKLQPKISPENTFIKNFCTIVNMTKHSSGDVLDIEPNPVKLARQSIDKVEEICNVFFDTMKEAKVLGTRVQDLVSAIRQGGGKEVEKADELFGILMKNEDFVIRMNNTCEFLGMLALINHSREKAGTDVDLTRWVELSERNSGFSQELRKGYLEVEAALLTNNGDQSSTEVLKECHKTCLEADKLLKKSLQSEENRNPTFPFPDNCPGTNTPSWKGNVKKQLKKDLKSQKISDDRNLLGIILEAQPCSNKDNYHFIAMRKFLNDRSRGIINDKVSIEKGTNSTESYGVLDLTRWCVNHAEKLASEVEDHFTQS
ncbi:uncharacterized protein [Asterias amurensis]|uniref:uncharacterized protein n=1 Tax=Asterias amurensis TaxID=7602 RepID=UPI003AB1B9F5